MSHDLDRRIDELADRTAQYELGATLSESQISEIEAGYEIALPPGFRLFLQVVGNGGFGPGFGLQRFAWVDSEGMVLPLPADGDPLGDVAFDGAIVEAIKGHRRPSRAFGLQAPVLVRGMFEDLPNAELEPLLVSTFEPAHLAADGTWLLSDHGCAIESRLVLHGERAGEVWVYERDAGVIADYLTWSRAHALDEHERMPDATFVSWYERWLDRVEAGEVVPSDEWPLFYPDPRDDDSVPSPVRALRAALHPERHPPRAPESRLPRLGRKERAAARQRAEDRVRAAKARQDARRPVLLEATARILTGRPEAKVGDLVDGDCPSCEASGPLMVVEGPIALCGACWRQW